MFNTKEYTLVDLLYFFEVETSDNAIGKREKAELASRLLWGNKVIASFLQEENRAGYTQVTKFLQIYSNATALEDFRFSKNELISAYLKHKVLLIYAYVEERVMYQIETLMRTRVYQSNRDIAWVIEEDAHRMVISLLKNKLPTCSEIKAVSNRDSFQEIFALWFILYFFNHHHLGELCVGNQRVSLATKLLKIKGGQHRRTCDIDI